MPSPAGTPNARPTRIVPGLLLIALLSGCPSVTTPELVAPSRTPVPTTGGPLKVHLMSGGLLVLDRWKELPGGSGLAGDGVAYDLRRQPVGPFTGTIVRDSIALLEVTRSQTTHPIGGQLLGAYSILTGALTIYCLADPKACFGSCPTFYLDGHDERPAAEGFSASVARALEATDVDDIGESGATGRMFHLTMRNEALEIHSVRSVRLLVVPRPASGAIVRSAEGRYFHATGFISPARCRADGGDCGSLVALRDGLEWSTRADSTDLSTVDSLDLEFPAGGASMGLVVAARQSFVSTYVFYQSLAYAGSHAGDLLAEVERRGTAGVPGAWNMMHRLSEVQVFAGRVGGALRPIGVVGEAGPIATDQEVLPLPEDLGGRPLHVQLRFARGAWRFDRLALVRLSPAGAVTPIEPAEVERDGVEDPVALARLVDPDRYLVTEPGDAYRLSFVLPQDAGELSIFLESRGYYYEMMRPEWLREEDLTMLGLIAARPDEALRRMAPGYARVEPGLDSLFWASRFGRR